jgi:hypothetical protein
MLEKLCEDLSCMNMKKLEIWDGFNENQNACFGLGFDLQHMRLKSMVGDICTNPYSINCRRLSFIHSLLSRQRSDVRV